MSSRRFCVLSTRGLGSVLAAIVLAVSVLGPSWVILYDERSDDVAAHLKWMFPLKVKSTYLIAWTLYCSRPQRKVGGMHGGSVVVKVSCLGVRGRLLLGCWLIVRFLAELRTFVSHALKSEKEETANEQLIDVVLEVGRMSMFFWLCCLAFSQEVGFVSNSSSNNSAKGTT